jgi:hypothetical protein
MIVDTIGMNMNTVPTMSPLGVHHSPPKAMNRTTVSQLSIKVIPVNNPIFLAL